MYEYSSFQWKRIQKLLGTARFLICRFDKFAGLNGGRSLNGMTTRLVLLKKRGLNGCGRTDGNTVVEDGGSVAGSVLGSKLFNSIIQKNFINTHSIAKSLRSLKCAKLMQIYDLWVIYLFRVQKLAR